VARRPVYPGGEDRVRPGGPPTPVTPGRLGYVSGMDDSVIAQLGVIATGEGSREERAAQAADLVGQATGARWVGIYTITSKLQVHA